MSAFQIEKGVPAPAGPGRTKYPFVQMEVGDSFFVGGGDANLISRAASAAGNRLSSKFACRTVDGGVRVWRVA